MGSIPVGLSIPLAIYGTGTCTVQVRYEYGYILLLYSSTVCLNFFYCTVGGGGAIQYAGSHRESKLSNTPTISYSFDEVKILIVNLRFRARSRGKNILLRAFVPACILYECVDAH